MNGGPSRRTMRGLISAMLIIVRAGSQNPLGNRRICSPSTEDIANPGSQIERCPKTTRDQEAEQ